VRETLEDSQFEQAVALREMGVMIPDSVLIDASRLMNKKEVIRQMEGDKNSPEAQAQAALQQRAQEAEVSKVEGEAAAKHADAQLKGAKVQETLVNTQIAAQGEPDDGSGQAKMAEAEVKAAQAEHEAGIKEREFERDTQLKFMEFGLKRELEGNKLRLQAQQMAADRADRRAELSAQTAAAAQRPTAERQK